MQAIFRQAPTETRYEQRALPNDVFAEVMEEVALAQAMDEGRQSEPVSRAAIFELLDSGE